MQVASNNRNTNNQMTLNRMEGPSGSSLSFLCIALVKSELLKFQLAKRKIYLSLELCSPVVNYLDKNEPQEMKSIHFSVQPFSPIKNFVTSVVIYLY